FLLLHRRERDTRFRRSGRSCGTGAQWDAKMRPHGKTKLGFFPLHGRMDAYGIWRCAANIPRSQIRGILPRTVPSAHRYSWTNRAAPRIDTELVFKLARIFRL